MVASRVAFEGDFAAVWLLLGSLVGSWGEFGTSMVSKHEQLYSQLCQHARETAMLSATESILGWNT